MECGVDLESWLAVANERYRKEGMPHQARPWRAIEDYGRQFSVSIEIGGEVSRAINDFFARNGPANALQVGALFTNAFWYDAHFWPVSIPIIFGQVALDPIECLDETPTSVKDALQRDGPPFAAFLLHWANCLDYAYGLSDLKSSGRFNERASAFARNADAKLRGAVSQLVLPKPITNAALDLALAAEIWMKVLLIHEQGLDDARLKRLGHGIKGLAEECANITGNADFLGIAEHAGRYPKLGSRYDGSPITGAEAWEALSLTTITCSAVVRRFSDRGASLEMRRRLL